LLYVSLIKAILRTTKKSITCLYCEGYLEVIKWLYVGGDNVSCIGWVTHFQDSYNVATYQLSNQNALIHISGMWFICFKFFSLMNP